MNHLTNNQHNLKHGLKGHRLYSVWNGMNRRCYEWTNKNFEYYGARGIEVCAGWINDAGAFCEWALANGWVEGLQLDRIDNDGDYTPDNCRFVTCAENNKNKRLIQKNNSTGYRGVQVNSSTGRPFKASVKVDGRMVHLGYFDTAIDGAIHRDIHVIKNNLGLPINLLNDYMEDTLAGRQKADAIERYLVLQQNDLWLKSYGADTANEEADMHQWRLDRIKYCLEQLGGGR